MTRIACLGAAAFSLVAFGGCGRDKGGNGRPPVDGAPSDGAVDGAPPDGAVDGAPPDDGVDGGAAESGANDSAVETGSAQVSCDTDASMPFVITTGTLGPQLQAPFYDGPAVIERSSPTELVVAYFASKNTADGGVAGGAGELPLHVSLDLIASFCPWAQLPPGARVWLTKDPAGLPPPPFGLAQPNEAVAVRDKKDGRLLVASALNKPAAVETAPGSPTRTSGDQSCMTIHGSLIIHGDTDVVIGDGEVATVPIGGFACDVSVYDSTLSGTGCGGDVPIGLQTRVSIKAQDLAAAGATLDVGAPPACSRGSGDVQSEDSFTFDENNEGTTYDGPVVYVGRGQLGCFRFSATNRVDATTHAPTYLEVCDVTGAAAEPAIGQTLWALIDAQVEIIQRGQGGPPLMARVDINTTTAGATVAQKVGLPLTIDQGCAYAATTPSSGGPLWYLTELSFATTPPTVVHADTPAVVVVGGTSYEVWMSRAFYPEVSFTIAAR
jgi:hypothetical protein